MRIANQLPVKHLNHSKFPAYLDPHPAPSPLANCCSSLPGKQPPIPDAPVNIPSVVSRGGAISVSPSYTADGSASPSFLSTSRDFFFKLGCAGIRFNIFCL